MSVECAICRTMIDTAHDEHYVCRNHKEPVVFCSNCGIGAHCPVCGRGLRYEEASKQKEVFFDPTVRDLLGF